MCELPCRPCGFEAPPRLQQMVIRSIEGIGYLDYGTSGGYYTVEDVEWATLRLLRNSPGALQTFKEWVLGVYEWSLEMLKSGFVIFAPLVGVR